MGFYLPSEGRRIPLRLRLTLERAQVALDQVPETLADAPAPRSSGGPREFYSEGDYWWPDPACPRGVPYVRRDGALNPDAFQEHRLVLRRMVERVGALTVAYDVTRDECYRDKAAHMLESFFLDPDRGMVPRLSRAQAIPGICAGRGIGIIDGLHLIDVLPALPMLFCESPGDSSSGRTTYRSLRIWFRSYLVWLLESDEGRSERDEPNNHAIAWAVQVAAIARLLDDERVLALCRTMFTERFLMDHMAMDGSFPREIARTRPFNYAIFTLDLLVTLTHILSAEDADLWSHRLSDGRGVKKALSFLLPYLQEPGRWPHPGDRDPCPDAVLPVATPFMLLAARGGAGEQWLDLWNSLPAIPADPEVRRNIAIKEPYLWL